MTATGIALTLTALCACSASAIPIGQSDAGITKQDAQQAALDAHATWDKHALWLSASLRGANIYQQDEGRDDGASQAGFGPALALSDLHQHNRTTSVGEDVA